MSKSIVFLLTFFICICATKQSQSIESVETGTWNPIYYVTLPSALFAQIVGAYDVGSGNSYPFIELSENNSSEIRTIAYSSQNFNVYGVKTINGISNTIEVYPLNESNSLNQPVSAFCNLQNENQTVAFQRSIMSQNLSYLVSNPNPTTLVLHEFQYFTRNFTGNCTLTELCTFEIPSSLSNFLENSKVTGSSLNETIFQINILSGDIIYNLNWENCTSYESNCTNCMKNATVYQFPNNPKLVSIASYTDNEGNSFLSYSLSGNKTTNFIGTLNQTGSLNPIITTNSVGNLVYEPNLNQFLLQDSTSVTIYIQSPEGLWTSGVASTITNAWEKISYVSGYVPNYCFNNCTSSDNGACIDGTCQCSPGWQGLDCSICNSTYYCNENGSCNIVNGNRTCSCIKNFIGDQCQQCNSFLKCNNHGSCSLQNPNCECETGFSGLDCSQCSDDILCHSRGRCISNGTKITGFCHCEKYWKDIHCDVFYIPTDAFVWIIKILNYVTGIFWAITFIHTSLYILGLPIGNILTITSTRATLYYFQSFALLITAPDLFNIFKQNFRYFYLFNLDIGRAFNVFEVWTESSLLIPKLAIFLILGISWKWISNPRVAGKFFQIGHLLFFFFVVSLFERFHGCSKCPTVYNILATIAVVLILITLLILIYRLWKVLIEKRATFVGFQIQSVDEDYHSEKQYETPIFTGSLKIFLDSIFYPWSSILTFFGTRLCDVQAQEIYQQEEFIRVPNEPKIPQLKISVEEFLQKICGQINHDETELQTLINKLKGNWYTTVDDLRTLTNQDAECLGIPRRLFAAVQQELKKELGSLDLEPRQPTVSISRDPKEKPIQDPKIGEIYASIIQNYKKDSRYYLMGLDELIVRLFIFAWIVAILRNWPFWMAFASLLWEIYYLSLIIYHRPFLNHLIEWCEILTNTCLIFTTFLLLLLTKTTDGIEYILLSISILNVVAVVGASVTQIFYYFHKECSPHIELKEDDDPTNETTHLIPDSSLHKGSGEIFTSKTPKITTTTTILDSDSDVE